MPDDAALAAELLARAKIEANAALWAAVSEVVKDTEAARAKLARVAEDLASLWIQKLQGIDTTEEEKWLEHEARLVAARLGLQANTSATKALVITANLLLGIGSSFLSAFLKIPVVFPTVGPGGVIQPPGSPA